MSFCLPEFFSILRFCNLTDLEFDSIIEWGLTTNNVAAFRHCLGLLLNMSETFPDRVATLFRPIMTNTEAISTITQDSLASSCYLRVCWALYLKKQDSSYLKLICTAATQAEEASSLLAMELLCGLPFDQLNALNAAGDSGNGGRFLLGILTCRTDSNDCQVS
jgi:hypothetical protein